MQPSHSMQTPTPRTPGNMRANGVRTLAAWRLGRGTFFMEQCANGSLIPAA
jgi:hypothetical protein